MPKAKEADLRDNIVQDYRFLLPQELMAKWHPEIHAASDSEDDSTINIYDIIGEDFWTGQGMTAKIVSAVLRRNKGQEIIVNINSPGGDVFEGMAIYNLLKEHDAPVVVNVVGLAGSAASIVAMAGSTIKIAEAGFFMIHNAWSICIGNKNEMRDKAKTLEKLDDVMAAVYAKKTGVDKAEISAMMDEETWINGTDAVEQGFATSLLDSDEVEVDDSEKALYNSSLREVDVALAQAGKSRSERRKLLKDLTSTPGATVQKPATPSAGENVEVFSAFGALNETLKGI